MSVNVFALTSVDALVLALALEAAGADEDATAELAAGSVFAHAANDASINSTDRITTTVFFKGSSSLYYFIVQLNYFN
jgi:hypothetical protein